MPDWLVEKGESVDVRLLVVPRASRSEVAGVQEGRLRVRLAAPPVDGKANKALIAFLAKRLRASKSQLTLVSGDTSRRKVVRVDGLEAEQVRVGLVGE